MNTDAEFNALASMFQSVMQDVKQTYPAWENVCHKAIKLSSQLKATLVCMNSFVDAIQSVGDAANNLKGATRDIGACLTRVCIRQRSIENRLRGLADSLSDELAISIQNKCSQMKHRINEMDRQAGKFCRRVRCRKSIVEESAVIEQRRFCHNLLVEQRNQVSFFVSALLPVLNNELCLLDESSNVRQITEHLQSAVRSVNSSSLIETILGDLHQGADYTWRNCLSTNAQRTFSKSSYNHEMASLRAPSPCPSNATWPSIQYVSTNSNDTLNINTVSSAAEPSRRGTITSRTFTPPSPSHLPLTKPPLPKRILSNSSPVSVVTADFIGSLSEQNHSHRNGGSQYSSATDVSRDGSVRKTNRPLSFACDDAIVIRQSSYSSDSSSNKHLDYADSSQVTSQASAIIAESIQQIDQLGCDIDSYCKAAKPVITRQTIRFRSGSCKPPPPLERRNSTITAATSSAPSVAVIRAASNATSEYASSIASVECTRETYSTLFL